MEHFDDIGLDILLEAKAELNINLDDEILIKFYRVQKNYQFNSDQSACLQATEKLVENYVTQIENLNAEEG